MGGGKGGSGKEAAQARADEEARQKRIREGTARVNSIFSGSTTGAGKLGAGAAYDPTKTYYLADGTAWKPSGGATGVTRSGGAQTGGLFAGGGGPPPQAQQPGMFGNGLPIMGDQRPGMFGAAPGLPGSPYGGGQMVDGNYYGVRPPAATGGAAVDPAAEFAQMLAGGKLYGATQKNGGFDDNFFSGRRQAYMDYASPQLADQYSEAQRQLTFALARNGTLDSSVRGAKVGELQKQFDLQKQQVADQAVASETTARNAVEDARANLIATLNATGDAEGAANSALARASALSQPAAYSPLSNLFADFTAGLGARTAQERADYYGGGGASSPTGNYRLGGNKNSVRVR